MMSKWKTDREYMVVAVAFIFVSRLRSELNDLHLGRVFTCNILTQNVRVLVAISFRFVLDGLINDN